jgi:predicted nicotinamide N-methyase
MEDRPVPLPGSGRTVVRVGRSEVIIEAPGDFEVLLDYYAREHPADTDLIPYHGALWPSALALADRLVSRFPTLEGLRAIELGCGLGLPSILAAKLGARMTANDFHPANEEYLRRNAALNGVSIEYLPWSWEGPFDAGEFDLVLASDVVYEKKSVPALATLAARLCAPAGQIILSDPGRDNLQEAVEKIEAKGFESEVSIVRDCFVVEFSRK